MANEKRKRQNAIGGLVEDNPLTSGATTLTSAALASVTGGVGSTEHFVIVLDPDGLWGAPEIVYVTALTGGAGSGTIARGQEGTTARAHDRDVPWVHAPTVKDYDGSGGGVGLIGVTSYNPGSETNSTTSSTTSADVDATNLKVDFTVPPSGKVLVKLTGSDPYGNPGVGAYIWSLRESSSELSGSSAIVGVFRAEERTTHTCLITGLTAGASKTYKWGHRMTAATPGGFRYGGADRGPALMEVWAVNL